ncbi:hypothetical protein K32_42930 [Kaistia sp. 32K]|nr:hypothetical protein K32_42930 [Kaistia sp. 32K]
MVRSSVDLPAPLAPVTASSSLCPTAKDKFAKMLRPPRLTAISVADSWRDAGFMRGPGPEVTSGLVAVEQL